MTTGPASPAESGVRAVVIYRHALLRDILVRLLSNARVDVAGVYQADDLDLGDLEALEPDVVVVDRAADEVIGQLWRRDLFRARPECAGRIVIIGLTDKQMQVYCRRNVADASAESLVRAVLGPHACARPTTIGAQ